MLEGAQERKGNSTIWKQHQKTLQIPDLLQYPMGVLMLQSSYMSLSEVKYYDGKSFNPPLLFTFQRACIWPVQVHRDSHVPHASVA